jgi:hypothetical protein
MKTKINVWQINNIEFKINVLLTVYNLGLTQGMFTAEGLVLAGPTLFCNVAQQINYYSYYYNTIIVKLHKLNLTNLRVTRFLNQ